MTPILKLSYQIQWRYVSSHLYTPARERNIFLVVHSVARCQLLRLNMRHGDARNTHLNDIVVCMIPILPTIGRTDQLPQTCFLVGMVHFDYSFSQTLPASEHHLFLPVHAHTGGEAVAVRRNDSRHESDIDPNGYETMSMTEPNHYWRTWCTLYWTNLTNTMHYIRVQSRE